MRTYTRPRGVSAGRFVVAAALIVTVLSSTAGSAATKKRSRRKVARTTVATAPAPAPTPVPAPAPAPVGDTSTREGAEAAMAQQLLERVNAERALRGLAPLRWDDGLAALAKNWSQTMASTRNFAHRPKGATAGFAVPAMCCWENIYYIGGTAMTTSRLHDGWMRSTGHRNNILSPEVTVFGAGVVCGPDGVSFATENFGTETWKGLGTPPTPAEPRAPQAGADVVCPL